MTVSDKQRVLDAFDIIERVYRGGIPEAQHRGVVERAEKFRIALEEVRREFYDYRNEAETEIAALRRQLEWRDREITILKRRGARVGVPPVEEPPAWMDAPPPVGEAPVAKPKPVAPSLAGSIHNLMELKMERAEHEPGAYDPTIDQA